MTTPRISPGPAAPQPGLGEPKPTDALTRELDDAAEGFALVHDDVRAVERFGTPPDGVTRDEHDTHVLGRLQGRPVTTSPDCTQGKHTACSGDAWDHDADSPAACQCACHHVTLSGPRIWPAVLALTALATAGPVALVLALPPT